MVVHPVALKAADKSTQSRSQQRRATRATALLFGAGDAALQHARMLLSSARADAPKLTPTTSRLQHNVSSAKLRRAKTRQAVTISCRNRQVVQ
eukprot:1046103-Pleurochrysis_carterae.AAC.1